MLGTNAVTMMIGFVVGAALIGFVCTRLICMRLRGVEAMTEQMSQIDVEARGERSNDDSVEEVVVDAIPRVKANHKAFVWIQDPLCSICLGEYRAKQVLRIMPRCGHSFHVACIDEWLEQHATCPICRLSLHRDLPNQ